MRSCKYTKVPQGEDRHTKSSALETSDSFSMMPSSRMTTTPYTCQKVLCADCCVCDQVTCAVTLLTKGLVRLTRK